jgi:hypothetical protein
MQPNLKHVIDATNARAARVEERCSHVVVGYVTQHHALAKRSIVVDGQVRWFPNDGEFQRMMGWKKYPDGPGVPHAGWPADETPAPRAPVIVPVAAPSRPVLTAPPSAKLLESTEDALGLLAHELGCVYDVSIPHNAGWFVPGKPTACASAYDAIRGLVASLKAGGTAYEGKPAAAIAEPVLEMHPVEVPVPKRKAAPAPAIEQGALF